MSVALEKRDLDVGIFATFFSEDLDADEVIFVRSVAAVIAINLTIQDDCRRAGREWLGRHPEFLRRYRWNGLSHGSGALKGEGETDG